MKKIAQSLGHSVLAMNEIHRPLQEVEIKVYYQNKIFSKALIEISCL